MEKVNNFMHIDDIDNDYIKKDLSKQFIFNDAQVFNFSQNINYSIYNDNLLMENNANNDINGQEINNNCYKLLNKKSSHVNDSYFEFTKNFAMNKKAEYKFKNKEKENFNIFHYEEDEDKENINTENINKIPLNINNKIKNNFAFNDILINSIKEKRELDIKEREKRKFEKIKQHKLALRNYNRLNEYNNIYSMPYSMSLDE